MLYLYESSGSISVYVNLAERFFTYPAIEVCDRSTNTALPLPQFLFWGSGWNPVMDNKDKKRTLLLRLPQEGMNINAQEDGGMLRGKRFNIQEGRKSEGF